MEPEIRCDSPIELLLLKAIAPMLAAGATIIGQKQIGRHRVDFLIRAAGRQVVVECDGAEFHEFARDKARDIDLINSGVDDVVRLRGADIVFAMDGCLSQFQSMLPFVFGNTPPLSLLDMAQRSRLMAHAETKPIFRSRFPRPEPCRGVFDLETVSAVGMTDDRMFGIVQMKTPYWDRRFTGIRIWKLSDWLSFQADKAANGQPVSRELAGWMALLQEENLNQFGSADRP